MADKNMRPVRRYGPGRYDESKACAHAYRRGRELGSRIPELTPEQIERNDLILIGSQLPRILKEIEKRGKEWTLEQYESNGLKEYTASMFRYLNAGSVPRDEGLRKKMVRALTHYREMYINEQQRVNREIEYMHWQSRRAGMSANEASNLIAKLEAAETK